MLAPPREHAGLFTPLSAEALQKLSQEQELRRAYLGVLRYMHDLVCPYWDLQEHPTFDLEDTETNLGMLAERYFLTEDSLSRHVQENTEVARSIQEGADAILSQGDPFKIEELRREASSFMRGLLHAYNEVRMR